MAFYGRAKAYLALEEFDKALDDVERVIVLKSHWAKVRNSFLNYSSHLTFFS